MFKDDKKNLIQQSQIGRMLNMIHVFLIFEDRIGYAGRFYNFHFINKYFILNFTHKLNQEWEGNITNIKIPHLGSRP
jgi:hypothetical protein